MFRIRKRVYPSKDPEEVRNYSPRDSLVTLAKEMKEFGLLEEMKNFDPIAEALAGNYKGQKEKEFNLTKGIEWPFEKGEIPENCAEIALIFRLNENVPELPEEFFQGIKEQGYNNLGKYIKISGCLEYVPLEVFASLIRK